MNDITKVNKELASFTSLLQPAAPVRPKASWLHRVFVAVGTLQLALALSALPGCAAAPPPAEHDIEPVECSGEGRALGHCGGAL